MKIKIAIVIPAYKSQYLHSTLLSISKQTDKDFTLYIGDDNSPFNLEKIVNEFKQFLNITYKKFESNFGGANLTAQWDRCISMVKDENWIWLFSDDDLMDEDCIEKLKKELLETNSHFDLYRFNSKIINNDGETVHDNTLNIKTESSFEFALDRLQFKRNSYAIEYVFSKDIYMKIGSFVNFPLAWNSDDATWIKMGADKGICTIPDAKVYWRYSSTNISSSSVLYQEKIEASIQYLTWFDEWLKNNPQPYNLPFKNLQKIKTNFIYHQVALLNLKPTAQNIIRFANLFQRRISVPFFTTILFFIGLSTKKLKIKLIGFLKKVLNKLF
jgi:glycosyltransferase involved in cell wall biosynthesis